MPDLVRALESFSSASPVVLTGSIYLSMTVVNVLDEMVSHEDNHGDVDLLEAQFKVLRI